MAKKVLVKIYGHANMSDAAATTLAAAAATFKTACITAGIADIHVDVQQEAAP